MVYWSPTRIATNTVRYEFNRPFLEAKDRQINDAMAVEATGYALLTLFVVAATFSEVLSSTGALIRGDNLSSLNVANGLSSTTPAMNAIAREIAWRRIVYKWRYKISHLPAERNDEADALSRLNAVPRRAFLKEVLSNATFAPAPLQDEWLWRTRLDL